MVHLTTFMVATAAMMMGVQCLDQASAKAIEDQLVSSNVIPKSESSSEVHADGIIGDFLSHLPIPIILPSLSLGPLPKITDTPDNSIQFNLPGFHISKVSGSSVSAPSPQPSKANGKRAVYDMDDHVSSSVAAAAIPSESASNTHSRSVKAVLRARGIRAAEFRSKVAEEYSASQSASASSAHANPSHLARRGASSSASASDAQITKSSSLEAEVSQAALNLSDLAKLGEAILGHSAVESLKKEFESVSKAISKDLSKELSAHATEVAQLKSLISKVSNYKVSQPTP